MIDTFQRVKDMGARTYLFSFYSEAGSELKDKPPCDVDQYRRIQLARYLLDHNLSTKDQMESDCDERIINYGLANYQLDEIINSDKPFQTSGCLGKTKEGACNRPFGDGPPFDIRSFPFELDTSDIKKIRKQMGIW